MSEKRSADRNMRLCVVGVCNPLASDDGLGAEVVRRLQAAYTAARPTPGLSFETLERASSNGGGCGKL